MPRNANRTTSRRSWTADGLSQAIAAVNYGVSKTQAAKLYGIPKRTLRRYLRTPPDTSGSGPVSLPPLGSFRPVFTVEQEQLLVNHIIQMGECFYGLSYKEVRSLAFQMAEKNGIPHPFDQRIKLAGPDWLKSFLRRHPTLSLRAPENTSVARARGFNRESVNQFFDVLQRIYEEHEYPPSRVWNVDETSVSTVRECSFRALVVFLFVYILGSRPKPEGGGKKGPASGWKTGVGRAWREHHGDDGHVSGGAVFGTILHFPSPAHA